MIGFIDHVRGYWSIRYKRGGAGDLLRFGEPSFPPGCVVVDLSGCQERETNEIVLKHLGTPASGPHDVEGCAAALVKIGGKISRGSDRAVSHISRLALGE